MTEQIPASLQRFVDFLAANPSPTDCVAGKFYMVPCIVSSSLCIKERGWGDAIPLLGTVHEDRAIINFEPWHIHVDTRFLPDVESVRSGITLGQPVCLTHPFHRHKMYGTNWLQHCAKFGVLEVRKKKCRRSDPPAMPRALVPVISEIERAYSECRVVNGLCPHRGIPIACGREVMPGVRECPGHGLRWNTDGYMVCASSQDHLQELNP